MLVDDVVTIEHIAGLPSAQLHDLPFGDPVTPEASGSRPSREVRRSTRDIQQVGRSFPGMGKYIPNWRHWLDSSALTGLVSGVYWVLLGIIGIAPLTEGGLKWELIELGGLLSLVSWYALARASEKAEQVDRQMKELVRLVAASAASDSTIVAQNSALYTLLMSVNEAVQQKARFESAGSVTVTPGTGALGPEGFSPTVSAEALDKNIGEKEDAVLRFLRRLAHDRRERGKSASLS